MSALLQSLLLVGQLALAPGGLAAPNGPSPGQIQLASPAARQATDRAAAEAAAIGRARTAKAVEKQRLAAAYDTELAALDQLKRGRASWRRDRQISARKASSQDTAARLARLDQELRGLDAGLARAQRAWLAAIDAELQAGSARAAQLTRTRRALADALGPRTRKIILPDDSLDALADPEELAEQIALIERAELDLRREQRLLAMREERYGRMATLRAQRDRAAELSRPDDEVVRRGASSSASARAGGSSSGGEAVPDQVDGDAGAGGGAGAPNDDGGGFTGGGGDAPANEVGGEADDGAGFEASSVALVDVVDSSTTDALRRAGRSSDPATRRDAAARARKQVEARIDRLKRSRSLIERHLHNLER